MTNVMKVKQTLACGLHSPEKWQEDYNGWSADDTHNLPDNAPVNIYPVDEYPGCPNSWEHGSDISGSYFAGLKEDWALWLDFNECFDHTHDVAVVLSIQGINPVTGQTMIGDNPLRMEQYHKTCPVHKKEFKQEYFCEECGFKWPGQNYLASTGTPYGMFWLDGFRAPDGKVRQYIITADKMRGVAAQTMDKPEERVFAIGIAFYLSKAKRPDVPRPEKREHPIPMAGAPTNRPPFTTPMLFSPLYTGPGLWGKKVRRFKGGSYDSNTSDGGSETSGSTLQDLSNSLGNLKGESLGGKNISCSVPPDGESINYLESLEADEDSLTLEAMSCELAAAGPMAADVDMDMTASVETVTPVKKLEVGAGALVSQLVYDDPKNLKKYWEEQPAGMIYLNYCDEVTLKKILDAGKKATKKDGFMNGIRVGG